MTSKTLKLTSNEIDKLINLKLDNDRFEEVFDNIPLYHPNYLKDDDETHRDFIEDDGREYRWYIFKDTLTGMEHTINYTYNDEWPNDFMDCDTIEIVDNEEDSDIYVKN